MNVVVYVLAYGHGLISVLVGRVIEKVFCVGAMELRDDHYS